MADKRNETSEQQQPSSEEEQRSKEEQAFYERQIIGVPRGTRDLHPAPE